MAHERKGEGGQSRQREQTGSVMAPINPSLPFLAPPFFRRLNKLNVSLVRFVKVEAVKAVVDMPMIRNPGRRKLPFQNNGGTRRKF